MTGDRQLLHGGWGVTQFFDDSPAIVQELAVPRHCKYETLFGCAFLYADRSALFLSDPQFDFDGPETKHESRSQIFTAGWAPDLSVEECPSHGTGLIITPQKSFTFSPTCHTHARYSHVRIHGQGTLLYHTQSDEKW